MQTKGESDHLSMALARLEPEIEKTSSTLKEKEPGVSYNELWMWASDQSCLMDFIPGKVSVLPCTGVFVCSLRVWVRRLRGLCDPEMSSRSQRRPLLIGQTFFYTLICQHEGSIWWLLVSGLCAGVSGRAILDVSRGVGAPWQKHSPLPPLATMTGGTLAHQQLTYLTFISVREVDRCAGCYGSSLSCSRHGAHSAAFDVSFIWDFRVVGGGGSRPLLLGGHAWTHPIGAISRPGARADRMPGQNQWPQWMLEIPISGRSNFPASLRNFSSLHSRHVQGTLGFQFTHFLFKRSLKTSPLAQKVFYAFTLCSQSLSLWEAEKMQPIQIAYGC